MLTAEQRTTAALLVLILKDECATNSMMRRNSWSELVHAQELQR
jgi:hypothetical protein